MIVDGRERKSLITSENQRERHAYSNPGFFSGNFHYPDLQEFGRRYLPFVKPRKNRDRAIFKNGDCNVHRVNFSKLSYRYLHDIFTSLVDIHWRWSLMIYALAYFVSWLFFALIWWLIMFTHGDLEDEHLPPNQAESNWTPCVLGIHNFTSCYLFSLETQYTIGYGVRTTTEECPQAIFIMSMQAIIGMTVDAFFLGIVFAKMTRPMLRNSTLLFSKNALVSSHDGDLCLMFRAGDMRKSPLVGANIRAQLIKSKQTKEGEVIINYVTELELNIDGGGNDVFFLWPVVLFHKINEDSPFYHLSASDLVKEYLEVVVVLEGTVESTGQSIQARTSYLGNEILWGYKFEPIVNHLKRADSYDVNYDKFNSVYPVETPLCSAAEMASFGRAQSLPDHLKPESVSTSFGDDDDDESDDERPLRPPPPNTRSRSVPRNVRYDPYAATSYV